LKWPPGEPDAELRISRSFAGRRVMVVDDEPVNLEIGRELLDAVGLEVDTAEDGAQAVAKARERRYAAILMDMQMPTLNGIDATRLIRQLPGYGNVPVIAVTANVLAESVAAYKAVGAHTCLAKPFNPSQLYSILLGELRRAEEGANGEAAATV